MSIYSLFVLLYVCHMGVCHMGVCHMGVCVCVTCMHTCTCAERCMLYMLLQTLESDRDDCCLVSEVCSRRV